MTRHAEWDVTNEAHPHAQQRRRQLRRRAGEADGVLPRRCTQLQPASPESDDNRPVFAQLMLDEAFSKSDPQFAQQALQAFRKFGFQLVIVATVQNATTIQPYIDSVVMVSKTEPTGRNARPVASVATRTISEFTTLRQEMRATAQRVPAGA
jgi:ABC-type hemin transport system ATPase subunit